MDETISNTVGAQEIRDLLDALERKGRNWMFARLGRLPRYEGFDPCRLFKVLQSKSEEYNNNKRIRDMEIGGVKAANKKPFMDDMECMVRIFCSKGPNWKKLETQNDPEYAELVEMFMRKYDIQVVKRAPGQPLGNNDVVTPSRIAACMPQYVCKLYHDKHHDIRKVVTMSDIGMDKGISHAILSTSFPALMVKTVTSGGKQVPFEGLSMLLLISFTVSVMTDSVFNRNKTEELRQTPLGQLKGYFMAVYESKIMPKVERETCLKNFGFLAPGLYGVGDPIHKSYGVCCNFLSKRFPDEFNDLSKWLKEPYDFRSTAIQISPHED